MFEIIQHLIYPLMISNYLGCKSSEIKIVVTLNGSEWMALLHHWKGHMNGLLAWATYRLLGTSKAEVDFRGVRRTMLHMLLMLLIVCTLKANSDRWGFSSEKSIPRLTQTWESPERKVVFPNSWQLPLGGWQNDATCLVNHQDSIMLNHRSISLTMSSFTRIPSAKNSQSRFHLHLMLQYAS